MDQTIWNSFSAGTASKFAALSTSFSGFQKTNKEEEKYNSLYSATVKCYFYLCCSISLPIVIALFYSKSKYMNIVYCCICFLCVYCEILRCMRIKMNLGPHIISDEIEFIIFRKK